MNRFRARLQFICLLFILCGFAVAGRLFIVQVVRGPELAERCRIQSQQRCIIPARRGDIRDRCGRVLSANTQGDLSLCGRPSGRSGSGRFFAKKSVSARHGRRLLDRLHRQRRVRPERRGIFL